MTTSPYKMTEPLKVALVGLPERTQAALEAYIEGPGRHLFSIVDEASAAAAIFDFDHPGSRFGWTEFSAQSGRPGILLSIAEQNEANACWVAKPVTGDAMSRAAPVVAALVRARQATAAPAAVPLPAGSPVVAAAPLVQEPAAPEPEPEQPTPVAAAAASASAATPAAAPIVPAAPDNQPPPPVAPTAAATGSRLPAWGLPLAVAAALLIALGFWWRGGQVAQPAADNALAAAVRSAVSAGQKPVSAEEQRFIAAQLAEAKQRGTPGDDDLKARLDKLAADPKAQQEYVRSVYNKVHIDNAGAQARSPENELRSRIDALVNTALTDAPGKDGGFVAALGGEAREREAQMRTIEVQRGDTLGAIAARAYGDSKLYMKIFAANPRILTSPDHIFPGQILRVPNA